MKSRKYIVLLVTILFLPVETIAQKRIDKNQALIVSENYFRSIGIFAGQMDYIEEDYLNDTLCLYCMHYKDGRWAIISASEQAYPVLAFGKNPNMTLLYNDNTEFNAHIWRYKRSILDADNVTLRNSMHRDSIVAKDISERWQKLLFNAKGIKSIEIDYTPNVELLNIPSRGKIVWGQHKNNDEGCYPSYNKYCRVGVFDCKCIRTPTGCAPVAMGQVMWYWQWPLYSPEDGAPYVWDEMPEALYNGTDTSKANKVAKLLYDLGQNMSAIYSCDLGTGVLQANAYYGFVNFGYEAIDIRDRSDWRYGYAWTELVRTEINCNRPVVVYGEDGSFVHGHYFVVDGYRSDDNNFFHINWGWRGNGYAGNGGSEYYLLYATDYSDNMSVYVGISPSYNSSKILQYYHDNQSVTSFLYAEGNLTLPDAMMSTIGAGQNVKIKSGQSVALSPGFEASAGSEVSIEIDENFQTSFDIIIIDFPDYDNINANGAEMTVVNANSFECSVYKVGYNEPVYQHSDIIKDNTAILWDGTDYDPELEYKFDVTFRNNFGKKYHIIFYNTQGETTPAPENGTNEDVHFTADRYTYVMPNPASGNVTVASSFRIGDVELLDLNGRSHLRITVDGLSAALDISSLPAGTYIVRVTTSAGTAYKKLVVK